jgi:hypothetical protein
VIHQFNTKMKLFLSLFDTRVACYACKQSANQSSADYQETFRANIEVLEYYKTTAGESFLLVDDSNDSLTIAERTKITSGRTIAMGFFCRSDPRQYALLLSDLANQQTRVNNQYPIDMTSAYNLLVNCHTP